MRLSELILELAGHLTREGDIEVRSPWCDVHGAPPISGAYVQRGTQPPTLHLTALE